MHLFRPYLVAAMLPVTSMAANPSTWEAYFWSGSGCTSTNTGYKAGSPAVSRECHEIPDLGVTQSIDFYAASTDYRIALHQDAQCNDVGGIGYQSPQSDLPTCIETDNLGGAVAYSVLGPSTGLARRLIGHERRLVAMTDAATSSNVTDIAERGLEARAIDSFVLTGVVGAFGFLVSVAEYCPRVLDPKTTNLVSYPPCVVSATGTIVVTFLTAFGRSGEESKKDQDTSKRSLFDLLELPTQTNHTILPGYQLSVHRKSSRTDDNGDEWHGVIMDIFHEESGHRSQAKYERHHATSRHMISSPAEGVSFHDDQSGGLETRASNFYAYYAWTQEVRSTFRQRSRSHQEINQLTGQLWNHARSNNVGIFCANFAVFGTRANTGIFSIQNGVFSPDFSQCR